MEGRVDRVVERMVAAELKFDTMSAGEVGKGDLELEKGEEEEEADEGEEEGVEE